jgi:hypothetical protein
MNLDITQLGTWFGYDQKDVIRLDRSWWFSFFHLYFPRTLMFCLGQQITIAEPQQNRKWGIRAPSDPVSKFAPGYLDFKFEIF